MSKVMRLTVVLGTNLLNLSKSFTSNGIYELTMNEHLHDVYFRRYSIRHLICYLLIMRLQMSTTSAILSTDGGGFITVHQGTKMEDVKACMWKYICNTNKAVDKDPLFLSAINKSFLHCVSCLWHRGQLRGMGFILSDWWKLRPFF